MAIWAALERHWKTYAVFVALSLLVKEDVSLVIVPLGIWVAVKRDRRIGLITIVGSVGFTLFATLVVMRSLIGVPTRNTWRIPFGGVRGFVETTFRRPGDVIDHLRDDGRPWYVWQMLTPFAYVFLRRPSVALIGGLALAANVVSTFWYQYHVQYHYSLVIVPPLALGTAYAVASLGPAVRTYAVAAVGVFAVYCAFLWGPLPFSRNELAYWAPDHPVAEQMRDLIDSVPADAVVSAYHRVTPHMAHRKKIYQFPNPFRVVLYGPDIEPGGHAPRRPCRGGRVRRATGRQGVRQRSRLGGDQVRLRAGRGQRVVGALPARRPPIAAPRRRRRPVDRGSAYSAPLRQGPVIAKVMPGDWRLAKSQLPRLGSNVAPAHSEPL